MKNKNTNILEKKLKSDIDSKKSDIDSKNINVKNESNSNNIIAPILSISEKLKIKRV